MCARSRKGPLGWLPQAVGEAPLVESVQQFLRELGAPHSRIVLTEARDLTLCPDLYRANTDDLRGATEGSPALERMKALQMRHEDDTADACIGIRTWLREPECVMFDVTLEHSPKVSAASPYEFIHVEDYAKRLGWANTPPDFIFEVELETSRLVSEAFGVIRKIMDKLDLDVAAGNATTGSFKPYIVRGPNEPN